MSGGSTAHAGATPHSSPCTSSDIGARRTGPCEPAGRPIVTAAAMNTSGGIAPTTGCDASAYGKVALVPYTTDYYFYRASQQ